MLTPEKRGPGPGKGGGKDNHCPVLSCTVINSFWISHELSWSRGRIYFNICPNQSHHLASPSSETDRGALLAAPCSVGGSHHEAESTGLWPCRGKVVFGSKALGDPLLKISRSGTISFPSERRKAGYSEFRATFYIFLFATQWLQLFHKVHLDIYSTNIY